MDRELSSSELKKLQSTKALITLLSKESINIERTLRYLDYERKLIKLQIEVIKLQTWAIQNNERIIVIFEGRDAAGKGGAIRRIAERINPRNIRIVALQKPTEDEQTQWYFQRYIQQFPKAGEMVLFNRSWYNRAVLEPVNGFCTDQQYKMFMGQVNEFERMILESGIHLVKIYMSISKKEQAKRFEELKSDPLKQWKMSPVDERAQELWDDYTKYKQAMFDVTNTDKSSWKVIKANRKTEARINAINYLLKMIPYDKDIKI
ncbi:MAG: Thymidylate kinase [Flavobacterium sp. SCGC AAA160-P02]|nr:MAG: Thymidylate kinase [Flavobacterium sp. SCGC AAA160-P02]